jgi:nucleoside-diphosphate kinase
MKKFCFALFCLFFCSRAIVAAESTTATTTPPAQKEITFSMIKPRAVQECHVGEIIHEIEKAGFTIVGMKMVRLTEEKAKAFYKEHEGKSFFADLVAKMSSGPIIAMALQRENGVQKMRDTVGATNPEKASPGTIRALFGKSVSENAIHASDSLPSATREVEFFFSKEELTTAAP